MFDLRAGVMRSAGREDSDSCMLMSARSTWSGGVEQGWHERVDSRGMCVFRRLLCRSEFSICGLGYKKCSKTSPHYLFIYCYVIYSVIIEIEMLLDTSAVKMKIFFRLDFTLVRNLFLWFCLSFISFGTSFHLCFCLTRVPHITVLLVTVVQNQ